MVERFLSQTSFSSQEDFIKNLKINVPENFNFGYDVVDAWAAEQPDKNALLWYCNSSWMYRLYGSKIVGADQFEY